MLVISSINNINLKKLEIVEETEITDKNWNDILNLPCVYAVYKTPAYEVFIKQDLATDAGKGGSFS